jgi:hypothetical protein
VARCTDLYLLFVFVCLFVHFFGTGRAGMCCLFLFVCHCFFSWLAGHADLYVFASQFFVCLMHRLVHVVCFCLFVCTFCCTGRAGVYVVFVFVCLSLFVFFLVGRTCRPVCAVCLSLFFFLVGRTHRPVLVVCFCLFVCTCFFTCPAGPGGCMCCLFVCTCFLLLAGGTCGLYVLFVCTELVVLGGHVDCVCFYLCVDGCLYLY